MIDLHGKKILFLSVSFFNYEKAITKRLSELGADVDFYDERPSNSNFSKGIIRFNKRFYHLKIKEYYNRILDEIRGKKYDFFLLIKGEATPAFFLDKIKVSNPKMEMIYYNFDPLKEYPELISHLTYFDKKFTFEYNDSVKYNLNFRPLFYLDEYENPDNQIQPSQYDLVFIGSAHTDRYVVGEKVRTVADGLNLRSYFYYYAMGRIAFRLKKMIDKNLKQFDISKVSFNKLNHQQIIDFYKKTKAVLDINKPFQNGLTIRTFEVLASGRKLITTNSDIRNYPFYNSDNILVIDRENIRLDMEFFETDFKEIDADILYKMSLDSFIECLFGNAQDDYWNTFRNTE
ncbi:lipopolysaccharide biosynthesis protein [Chryseobacterium shandongense]|uniref:Lipopolysaccharide biosynthesis protein n=1 Tax=Chryseobacterium shandongense TaxID=1493872 RepID=A0AAD1DP96_9FLAO|nr:lipopolysaccharide biosynthesis protein [Chryseobacterium shandongense]AZA88399.1 lipopolysaccharide biosynthesis protein [Chryseobacterium shandongense]AZA96942.1 lipopolysaccharide biosynthesis protein [Chryseobacterium shandongense]